MVNQPVDSRERLLEAATRLLSERGYHGTGVKEVMSESGTVAGSLYHHFPGGKEELAVIAVREAGEAASAILTALIEQSGVVGAIDTYYAATEKRLKSSDFGDGCPIGTPAADGAATEPSIQAEAAAGFAAWQKTIARGLVAEGWSTAEARALASCLLSLYEGAVLVSRAQRDVRPLRAAAAQSRRLVEGESA